jgi:hypothetical protein
MRRCTRMVSLLLGLSLPLAAQSAPMTADDYGTRDDASRHLDHIAERGVGSSRYLIDRLAVSTSRPDRSSPRAGCADAPQ